MRIRDELDRRPTKVFCWIVASRGTGWTVVEIESMRSRGKYPIEALNLEGFLRTVEERLDEIGWEGWEVVAVVPKTKAGEPWSVAVLKPLRAGGS